MAEYIDKDKAKELVCEFCTWVGTSNCEECEHPVDDVSAADVVPGSDFRACRNELCLRCGQYKTKHLGSCDGCRWEH